MASSVTGVGCCGAFAPSVGPPPVLPMTIRAPVVARFSKGSVRRLPTERRYGQRIRRCAASWGSTSASVGNRGRRGGRDHVCCFGAPSAREDRGRGCRGRAPLERRRGRFEFGANRPEFALVPCSPVLGRFSVFRRLGCGGCVAGPSRKLRGTRSKDAVRARRGIGRSLDRFDGIGAGRPIGAGRLVDPVAQPQGLWWPIPLVETRGRRGGVVELRALDRLSHLGGAGARRAIVVEIRGRGDGRVDGAGIVGGGYVGVGLAPGDVRVPSESGVCAGSLVGGVCLRADRPPAGAVARRLASPHRVDSGRDRLGERVAAGDGIAVARTIRRAPKRGAVVDSALATPDSPTAFPDVSLASPSSRGNEALRRVGTGEIDRQAGSAQDARRKARILGGRGRTAVRTACDETPLHGT